MQSLSLHKLFPVSSRLIVSQALRRQGLRYSTPSSKGDEVIVDHDGLPGTVALHPALDRVEWTENGNILMVSLLENVKASIDSPKQYEGKIQVLLLSLQNLYRDRPGTLETNKWMDQFLADIYPSIDLLPLEKWDAWKDIANQIHDTYHLAASAGAWTPTKSCAYRALLRLTSDPDMAEHWLAYQWRQCPTEPNKDDYTAVIQVWARSNRKDAGERAELVFRELGQKYLAFHKDPRWKPTGAAYVGWVMAVVSANSHNGLPREAATKASAILQEAWDKAEHDMYWPSTPLYNAVLNSWARAGEPDKAEGILRDMMQKSEENPFCKPNTTSFTTVINAWSKSFRKEAPVNAEIILELMEEHAVKKRQLNVRPNVVTYSTVLNCWAKSKHPDACLRASAILRHMRDLHHRSNLSCRPNDVTYNTCMSAWARSRKVSAPEEVERLFREMRANGLRPDRVTYMARINVLERNRRRNPQLCATKAMAILNEMIKLSDDGDEAVSPTTLHFNRVLVALGLVGDTNNAESILEHMITNWTNGQYSAGPDRFSFHCVLSAHAKQMTKESAIRCVALLDRMHAIDQQHNDSNGTGERRGHVAPNTVSYNTTISAWVRACDEETWERVLTLARRMKKFVIPLDEYSYAGIMQALGTSSLSGEQKHDRAVALLNKMERETGEIPHIVLRLAEKSLKPEVVEQLKKRM